jgi:hypothetical protein
VVDSKGDPVSANVFLASTVANSKGMQIKTDEDGTFFFSRLEPNTSYYIIAQSLNKEKKYFGKDLAERGRL